MSRDFRQQQLPEVDQLNPSQLMAQARGTQSSRGSSSDTGNTLSSSKVKVRRLEMRYQSRSSTKCRPQVAGHIFSYQQRYIAASLRMASIHQQFQFCFNAAESSAYTSYRVPPLFTRPRPLRVPTGGGGVAPRNLTRNTENSNARRIWSAWSVPQGRWSVKATRVFLLIQPAEQAVSGDPKVDLS
jgi:hypothetical protein